MQYNKTSKKNPTETWWEGSDYLIKTKIWVQLSIKSERWLWEVGLMFSDRWHLSFSIVSSHAKPECHASWLCSFGHDGEMAPLALACWFSLILMSNSRVMRKRKENQLNYSTSTFISSKYPFCTFVWRRNRRNLEKHAQWMLAPLTVTQNIRSVKRCVVQNQNVRSLSS